MNKTEFIKYAEKARKVVVENAIMDTSRDLKVLICSRKVKKYLCYSEIGQLNELGTFNRVLEEALKENERGRKAGLYLIFTKMLYPLVFTLTASGCFTLSSNNNQQATEAATLKGEAKSVGRAQPRGLLKHQSHEYKTYQKSG